MMTAVPATSARTASGPWTGISRKAGAQKAIPASGLATLVRNVTVALTPACGKGVSARHWLTVAAGHTGVRAR